MESYLNSLVRRKSQVDAEVSEAADVSQQSSTVLPQIDSAYRGKSTTDYYPSNGFALDFA